MALKGKAKTDYQRDYMRKRRSNELSPYNSKKQGYIYVIHCSGSTYYKIGITHSGIDSRLQSLQTGCPYKLIVAMMFATANPEADEYRLHKLLVDCRVQGEWYDLDPQRFADVIFAINPLLVGYVPPK